MNVGPEMWRSRISSRRRRLNEGDDDGVTDLTASPRLREEKGKGKAVPDEDAVKVKCRLSDRGGPDVTIMLGKSQLISVLAHRVQDEASVSRQFHTLLFLTVSDGTFEADDISRIDIEYLQNPDSVSRSDTR